MTSAPSPDDIRWLEGDEAEARRLACPVCADPGPHGALLVVRSMAEPRPDLTFVRCRACGSGLYDPPGIINFADLGHVGDSFWRFYVEVGGGVWETIWPILAVQGPRGRSLLDIGCGFGFAVDFWRREMGGEAIGVELADYGRIGAKLLGVPIHDRLLQEIPELDGRVFDIVNASEVIEHVPDATAFATLLARYVADDGVLVMTTPAMSYVHRENHSTTLHAALAPGFHGFLLSADAFASAVRGAGFDHVDLRVFGERQLLWASRRPLDVDTTPSRMLPGYVGYLLRRLGDELPHSPVWQGLAYRAVKEQVNGGRAAEARPLAMQLLDEAAAAFGEHVRDPEATAARIASAPSLGAIGDAMPYFLPCLYYHLGMIALQAQRDAVAGIRWLEGSVACTTAAVRVNATFFLEATSLVWPARVSVAEVRIALGEIARGAEGLAQACREGDRPLAKNAYACASTDLLERRVPGTAWMLAERGQPAGARTILAGFAEYVTRRYGAALLTAEGVDQALAKGGAMPVDPLLAPSLAALIDLVENRPDAPARAEAVTVVADRHGSHPTHGARLRDHASRLRRHVQPSSAARTGKA